MGDRGTKAKTLMVTKVKVFKAMALIIAAALMLPAAVLMLPAAAAGAPYENETPEAVYSGYPNALATLKNLDFTDVKNSNTWAKEAIYHAAALDIVKGYGNRSFGRTAVLSKEEAIALAYRAAGREADAQRAAEELDNARRQDEKKTDAVSMWSDGYLQLAANEGLISRQDLRDALDQGQDDSGEISFNRRAPAQRQEMAFWLARTLNLQPVYGQQEIFNSFNDWRSSNPIYIPYIEAILRNNIMNGDGNGYFNPTQPVTREQAAQIIKNADNVILPLLMMEKKTGTIENIHEEEDYTGNGVFSKKMFYVRNSNGRLHRIDVQKAVDPLSPYKNEQDGSPINADGRELVVYRDGQVGTSSLLKAGDRLEYIVSSDMTVRFVKVISNRNDVRYMAARINSVDAANLQMNVMELFRLDYPDISAADDVSLDTGGLERNAVYRYGSDISVTVDGKKTDVTGLRPDQYVILTINNNNVVTAVKTGDFGRVFGEGNIVKGIVEENNPQLGYITLYNEDGTKNTSAGQNAAILLRTFNYTNPNELEVFKNHEAAGIDDVEAGDTAFIRLDDSGNVLSISAVDNYTVKFAKVVSKSPSRLLVEYDNGLQQSLPVDGDFLVVSDGRIARYADLKDGDRVRLLLHITDRFTRIKEIAIEGDEHFITNLYKGTVVSIDHMSDKLVVQNLMTFYKGQWRPVDQKGFSTIRLSDEYSLYSGNSKLKADSVNDYYRGSEAYIAVEKDYGGEERAVFISFRNDKDTEVLYDDSVMSSSPTASRFSLSKSYLNIGYGPGSIVLKHGRLVSGRSIGRGDTAYVVANRSYGSGEYSAGIVVIEDRPDTGSIQLYRGRIRQINEGVDFTVESFSRLNGLSWEFSNTPKTFRIQSSTRILDDGGVVGQRDFKGYGDDSFIGRTVYILADDINAVLVSTAPYGIYNVKGEIYEIAGGAGGTTGIFLRKVSLYDTTDFLWKDAKDMTLNILKNSIVIKDGKAAGVPDLRPGDQVRVIKKDNTETGDAYIIIVEN